MFIGKVYIAGPFFNPAQVELIKSVESELAAAGFDYFSPRQHSANVKKGPLTNEDAKEIYGSNLNGLHACDTLLAVVDWILPPGQEVGVRTRQLWPEGHDGFVGVHIPDSGTVFEMGYVASLKTERGGLSPLIVLFTTRDESQKLNVMLSQCTDGVLYGLSALRKFLTKPLISPGAVQGLDGDPKALKGWKGEHL